MKTIIWKFLLVLIFSLALTACGGAEPVATQSSVNELAEEFEMPRETMLVMGTIALEETDLAVDAQQAAVLLPLWKAVVSLTDSDTAAIAEIDAVYNQIENAMKDEQLAEIESMELGMQHVSAIMADLGVESGMNDRFANLTDEQLEELEAMREQGSQGPGGGGIGGGQGPGAGGGSPPEGFTPPDGFTAPEGGFGQFAQGSSEGDTVQAGNRMGANTMLINAVIQLLESKLQ